MIRTFTLESEIFRQVSTFVVTTEDCNSVSVAKLESNKERDSLHGIVSSVDVVAHEKVVCVRRVAADPEEF